MYASGLRDHSWQVWEMIWGAWDQPLVCLMQGKHLPAELPLWPIWGCFKLTHLEISPESLLAALRDHVAYGTKFKDSQMWGTAPAHERIPLPLPSSGL